MPPSLPLRKSYRLMLTLGVMLIITLSMVAAILGWMEPRPDYDTVIHRPKVMLKQALPLLAVLVLLPGFSLVCYPETETRWPRMLIALVAVSLLPIMFVFHLFLYPTQEWIPLIQGGSMTRCIVLIPLLASVVLSVQIFVLRRGASSQPVLAGMQAGLIAGAISTIVYANFCTEDDPMFYDIWYGFEIAISMLIGALSGWRFLRW